jgi:hypothetical protein
MANSKLQFELGADHLTFTCTNKLGGKISCPSIWWGKKCCKTAWLQGSI